MLDLVIVSLLWFFFAGVAATIAEQKGRSAVGFAALAFLLSPVIGVTAAILALPNRDAIDKRKLKEENQRCPHCAEIIRKKAKVCRYCGRDLVVAASVSDAPIQRPDEWRHATTVKSDRPIFAPLPDDPK